MELLPKVSKEREKKGERRRESEREGERERASAKISLQIGSEIAPVHHSAQRRPRNLILGIVFWISILICILCVFVFVLRQ